MIWKNRIDEFELAHIFAHKETTIHAERNCFASIDETIKPLGEFTNAANLVLVPKGFARPTDSSPTIKAVFFQRFVDLYAPAKLWLPLGGGSQGFLKNCVPAW